ncbi:MAG: sulfatase-like hydrolase/transferase [Planctomycetota bacterium]
MSQSEPTRPNILVLFSDTHSADATGCYGSPVAQTPHMDRLAGEGVLFERAYCQNPLCVPSRQSLITGRYSFQTGIIHNDQPMPAMYTLGHHFKQVGYDTAALGKMHFIPDTEASLGKERHFGFDDRVDYEEFYWYLRNERAAPPLPDEPDDPWRIIHLEHKQHVLQAPLVKRNQTSDPSKDAFRPATLPHEDHQEALVLRRWAEFLKRPREKPFLAFVSFQSPHPPFIPPEEILAQHDGPIPLPPLPGEEFLKHPIWRNHSHIAPDPAREKHLRYYHAFVSYTDWCVGEALRLLDEAGRRDDTLVIYVSDHGDMQFVHGMGGKCVFFEPSVHVPLIMRWPGRIAAAWRYRGLVELVDLFPTFCECAGITPPSDLPGRSLWRDLQTKSDRGKEIVFSESYPMERSRNWMGDKPHRMVLTNQWKLVQYGDTCVDLFDVTTDPENKFNRSDDPALAQVKRDLLRAIQNRLGDCHGANQD